MSSRKLNQFTSLVAALGLIASTAIPALAAPVPSSAASLRAATASPVIQVRARGHRGGWHGHRGGWHGHRGGWHGGGGVAAGVIGGMILGGIIASQADPYYYGPGYYYAPAPAYYGPSYNAWLNYCFSRYRSFDPRSGTYLGYDGLRHYCR